MIITKINVVLVQNVSTYLDTRTVHFYYLYFDQLLHSINILITYSYIWFAATCFDVNTSSSGSPSCMAKITYIVDTDNYQWRAWLKDYRDRIKHVDQVYPHYIRQN